MDVPQAGGSTCGVEVQLGHDSADVDEQRLNNLRYSFTVCVLTNLPLPSRVRKVSIICCLTSSGSPIFPQPRLSRALAAFEIASAWAGKADGVQASCVASPLLLSLEVAESVSGRRPLPFAFHRQGCQGLVGASGGTASSEHEACESCPCPQGCVCASLCPHG